MKDGNIRSDDGGDGELLLTKLYIYNQKSSSPSLPISLLIFLIKRRNNNNIFYLLFFQEKIK